MLFTFDLCDRHHDLRNQQHTLHIRRPLLNATQYSSSSVLWSPCFIVIGFKLLIVHWIRSNADLSFLRKSLTFLICSLGILISCLSTFAAQYHDLPTVGFTHFQLAQLTTVGKCATLWIQVCLTLISSLDASFDNHLQELLLDLRNLKCAQEDIGFCGMKGTTRTQASFLALFNGDHEKASQASF